MMTWQQFDAQLQTIDEQHKAGQERIDGKRDQRLARLFLKSERTQEELAQHLADLWHKEVSRIWVVYHLRFGRFLNFFVTLCDKEHFKLPPNLTEGGFRKLWEQTESAGDFRGHKAHTEAAVADEQRRFGEVFEALKEIGLARRPRELKAAMVQVAGRGQWLTLEELRQRVEEKLGGTVLLDQLRDSLIHYPAPSPKCPYRVEKAGEGDTAKYRFVKIKGTIASRKQLAAWSHDVVPLLDDLIREAHKSRVEISLSHLCVVAGKIKKIMEGLTAKVPEAEGIDREV